ncbi:MAG: matrixin family metalloprotease [Myxococcota bacterium]
MATSLGRRLAASALALSCAAAPKQRAGDALPGASEIPQVSGSRGESDDGFLQPNAEDSDGTPMYVHYTAEDMPLRVDVQLPKLAARYASREQTDAAVLEAIRGWEAAIQPSVPWFKLEIVRGERDADIEVQWKSRITGDASGWGGLGWSTVGGRIRVRGRLEYATKPCLAIECQLDLGQLKLIVTHEFGHTLGLMHCLDCDSAMNYSWETRERVLITEVDLRTIRALYALPNGTRVDGTLARSLRPVPR